jgi:hypothetical protein
MQFLSAAEVERLAEAIAPPYGLLVRFAAHTGLRAGELAALRVKRPDLLRGTVRVVESASEVGGRLMLGSTKTYAERTVPEGDPGAPGAQLHSGDDGPLRASVPRCPGAARQPPGRRLGGRSDGPSADRAAE